MGEHQDIRTIKGMRIAVIEDNTGGNMSSLESDGFQERLILQAEPYMITARHELPEYVRDYNLERKRELNQSQAWKKKHKKY